MQRILDANWQFHLISAIKRGQFLIHPEMALGMSDQIAAILKSSDLYNANLQKLDKIPVQIYAGDLRSDADDALDPDREVDVVMIFPVKGVMMKYGTLCTYGMSEIAAIIKQEVGKERVSGVVLDIDSGGGAVNAVPPILDAIEFVKSIGKPIAAHVDTACSAAYWTASACDRIFVNNQMSSTLGSIGVMIQFVDMLPYYEKIGAKVHTVYSDLSQNKNEAFEKMLKGEYEQIKEEMLNPLAKQFQEAVKANRDGKLKADTPGILTGATFIGNDAIEVGLADQLGSLADAIHYVQVKAWAKQ